MPENEVINVPDTTVLNVQQVELSVTGICSLLNTAHGMHTVLLHGY